MPRCSFLDVDCALRSHSQLLHVIKFISIIVLKYNVLRSAFCSAPSLLPVWLVHLPSPSLLLSLVALGFACLTTSCVVQTSVFHNSSECFFHSRLHCGFCQTCSGLSVKVLNFTPRCLKKVQVEGLFVLMCSAKRKLHIWFDTFCHFLLVLCQILHVGVLSF